MNNYCVISDNCCKKVPFLYLVKHPAYQRQVFR